MDSTMTRVSALFAIEGQSTNLTMIENIDGTYDVKAFYRKTNDSGFPARELTERDGKAYLSDVETLMNTVLAFCRQGWYHHYTGKKSFYASRETWWSLRIEYADGRVERWEGINAGPKTIDDVFDALVAFGMPSMRMPLNGTFGGACVSWRRDPGLDRLTGYVRLLAEACESPEGETPDEDGMLVVEEFHDDVLHYLREVRPELLGKGALAAWGVKDGIEGLCEEDVTRAPRQKMLALYGALVQLEDYRAGIVRALDEGVLKRWGNRLELIPEEELEEQGRRLEEERQTQERSIDKAIREHMADGKVFTSYDIATQTGSSAQHASARIRSYVRKGELIAMPGDYPRRYKAAVTDTPAKGGGGEQAA